VTEGDAAPGSGSSRRRRRSRRRRGQSSGQNGAQNSGQSPTQAATSGRNGGGESATRSPGTLGESLQAAVLHHTTGPVLSRGRGYVARKRVTDLRVSAGRVRGRVLGSGNERYRVEIAAPERPAPEIVTKVRWSCDCPYAAEHRRGTCKHVVALALVASKRIDRTPALRQRWLGQPAANAAAAEPAELDALAERLLAAFTVTPVSVDEVMERVMDTAPPPFEVRA
jgi:hypothetical protein